MIPDDMDEDLFPVNNSLHGFGRGLFVSTSEIEGISPVNNFPQDPTPQRMDSFKDISTAESMAFISDALSKISTTPQCLAEGQRMRRTHSVNRFAEDGNITANFLMKKQLSRLSEYLQANQPEKISFFRQEMENFQDLFRRFLAQKNLPPLVWNKVQSLSSELVI